MHDLRRTRSVLMVLLIVAIVLITIDFRDSGASSAHSLGGRLFGPLEHAAGDVTGWAGGGSGSAAEISALQRQNDALRAELASSQVAGQDAAQLAGLTRLIAGSLTKGSLTKGSLTKGGLTKDNGYRVVDAAVIAAGGDYSDTVTIGAGSGAGIAANETVLNGDGLVGTVVSVTRSTATVQLATDAGATVGVRMAGSGQIGALEGTADTLTGTAPLRLTLFSATATLKPGDRLVTFGSVGGRPYVAGVPVGRVATVTTKPGSLTPTALVQPFADFTGLGVVGVVVGTAVVSP